MAGHRIVMNFWDNNNKYYRIQNTSFAVHKEFLTLIIRTVFGPFHKELQLIVSLLNVRYAWPLS